MTSPLVPSPESSVVARFTREGWTLALAESCTGGGIGARVTAVPGASAVLFASLVVYANEAKTALLGVPPATLAAHGAVSRETALAMLDGLFVRTPATVGGSVTGIAGPDGGTPEKPVGTVWIGWGDRERRRAERLQLDGDREAVRRAAADAVLARLAAWPEDAG